MIYPKHLLLPLLLILPVSLSSCASGSRAVQGVVEPYRVDITGLSDGQFSTNLSYLAVQGQVNFSVGLYESGDLQWSRDFSYPSGRRVYRINLGGDAGWGLQQLEESEWGAARVSLRGLPWDVIE